MRWSQWDVKVKIVKWDQNRLQDCVRRFELLFQPFSITTISCTLFWLHFSFPIRYNVTKSNAKQKYVKKNIRTFYGLRVLVAKQVNKLVKLIIFKNSTSRQVINYFVSETRENKARFSEAIWIYFPQKIVTDSSQMGANATARHYLLMVYSTTHKSEKKMLQIQSVLLASRFSLF